MTYAKGSTLSAVDYNGLAGVTASAAASAAAATQVAGYLWGVGFGDRGYGQSSPALTALSSGALDSATAWSNLRSVLNSLSTQQGTAVTLPAAPASGGVFSYDSNYASCLSTLDSNRLTAAAAGMTLTANALTITRTTSWGSGNTNIVAVASVTFPSEDAARYFFNTGGQLTLSFSQSNTSTTQNANWNTVFTNLGTISIGAQSTTRSGTGGTPVALGYFGMTTAYQTVFNGANIGTGSYTANSILVEMQSTSIPGVNGGKGAVLNIRVTLTDGHTNAFSDSVSPNTSAIFGFKKSTVNVSGISSPTVATVTNF